MTDRLNPFRIVFGLGVVVGGIALYRALPAPQSEEASPVVWRSPVEVATAPAQRGPWRMNDSNWDFVDDPAVALTEEGTAGVVWTNHARQDLFFQRYDAGQLEAPINVSKTPATFSWLPRVVFPNGHAERVYVLWQEIVFSRGTHGGEAFFARSTDGGRTFSAPMNLSNSVAGDGKGRLTRRRWDNGSLDLAVGPSGRIYAVWTAYEGALWVSRSADGRQFSDPIRVAGSDSLPARGPTLAVDRSGRVHLVWATGGTPDADLRYARSADQGRSFSAPMKVAPSDGHSDAPSLAVDSSGTLHLAFAEQPRQSSSRYHLRYTRRPATDDSFRAPSRIIPGQSGNVEGRHYPTLRTGPAGRLMVLWERFPSWGERPRGLGIALSRDEGRTFSDPTLVPGSADDAPGFNGSQQGLLMDKLALNSNGAVAVVNSTFKRGERSAIWLHRGHVAGP